MRPADLLSAEQVTTLYTVGAIFFVRTFLRAFNCVGDAAVDGIEAPLYMASSPDIECTLDDPSSDYPAIRRLSINGLAVFGALFAAMCLGLVRWKLAGSGKAMLSVPSPISLGWVKEPALVDTICSSELAAALGQP